MNEQLQSYWSDLPYRNRKQASDRAQEVFLAGDVRMLFAELEAEYASKYEEMEMLLNEARQAHP